MENSKSAHYKTFEEALKDPSLAHFHEVIRFLETTPEELILPRQYKEALERTVARKVRALLAEDAQRQLNKVVAEVINALPDTLSAHLLLEMTAFAIKEWEKRAAKSQPTPLEMQSV